MGPKETGRTAAAQRGRGRLFEIEPGVSVTGRGNMHNTTIRAEGRALCIRLAICPPAYWASMF